MGQAHRLRTNVTFPTNAKGIVFVATGGGGDSDASADGDGETIDDVATFYEETMALSCERMTEC